jgi:hypothetical protein
MSTVGKLGPRSFFTTKATVVIVFFFFLNIVVVFFGEMFFMYPQNHLMCRSGVRNLACP